MNFLLYLINNVLSQPIFIIGLVVILGMLAEKKSWDKILPSTIKAIIGFTMINIGGQTLGGALLPLQLMISKIFGVDAQNMTDIGAAQAESLASIGTEMALIFAVGFLINILLARLTPLKFVHLSP
ncbi:PTS transporter subunit IIC, partial [Streptococcus gordonii]